MPLSSRPKGAEWADAEAKIIRDQLSLILESELFAQGERQRRFLRYIVEATLEGTAKDLNQYAAGLDVFGRDASFDPTIESIVRVEATRLRSKPAEYYAAAGANDPVRIDLPKGGYPTQMNCSAAQPADADRVTAVQSPP